MSRVLHFDCFSGISGDMTVGALLDLGLDGERLKEELHKLGLSGYDIEISKQTRQGISGTDFNVLVHHCDHHVHRHLADIEALIENSGLAPEVKSSSIRSFRLLGEAEARVHNTALQQIHFHEVGALDAIIDIVSAAICMSWLKPERVEVASVNTGSGFVECAHGRLPVPAPATMELLKGYCIYSSGVETELATPTGAALLKTYAEPVDALSHIKLEQCGYGCGKKDLDSPNLLRVVLGEKDGESRIWVLETNIDDMNPDYYSYLFPLLLGKGALDAFITPVIMKKNRPGQLLSVICREGQLAQLTEALFLETSTLGIRKYPVQREELERDVRSIDTRYGPVPVKYGIYNGQVIKFSPEYEACQEIAVRQQIPLPRIYQDLVRDINAAPGGEPLKEANVMRRHGDHD